MYDLSKLQPYEVPSNMDDEELAETAVLVVDTFNDDKELYEYDGYDVAVLEELIKRMRNRPDKRNT